MKRIRTILSLTLSVSFLMTTIVACSSSSEKKKSNSSKQVPSEQTTLETTIESTSEMISDPTSTPVPTATSSPTPSPSPTPTPSPTPEIDLEHDLFAEAYAISEDRAWVMTITDRYMESNSTIHTVYRMMLVSKNGDLLFEEDFDCTAVGGPAVSLNPMQDGVCYLKNVRDGYEEIIDKDGHVLYKTGTIETSSTSQSDHIVAYGDNMFLILRFSTDISGAKYQLGIISQSGEILHDFVEISEPSRDHEWFYLEDGIFSDYDTNSNQEIDWDGPDNYTVIENGWYFGILQRSGACFYDMNNNSYIFLNQLEPEGKYPDFQDETINDVKTPWKRLDGDKPRNVNTIYRWHGFYDLQGNRILEISQYEDLLMWCSSFNSEGYAIMVVEGKDYQTYVTVIDRDGKEQFEPFRISFEASDTISDIIVNGKFAVPTNDGLCIYDIHGNYIENLGENAHLTWCGENYLIITDYDLQDEWGNCTYYYFL